MSFMFDLRESLVWSQTYAAVMQAMITKLPADADDLVEKASRVAYEAANEAVDDFDTAQEPVPSSRESKIREIASGLKVAIKNEQASYARTDTKPTVEVTDAAEVGGSTFRKEMSLAEINRGGIESFRMECAEVLLEMQIANGELDRNEYGKQARGLAYFWIDEERSAPFTFVTASDPENPLAGNRPMTPAEVKSQDPGTIDLNTVDPT